jgi:hypothetical protein
MRSVGVGTKVKSAPPRGNKRQLGLPTSIVVELSGIGIWNMLVEPTGFIESGVVGLYRNRRILSRNILSSYEPSTHRKILKRL